MTTYSDIKKHAMQLATKAGKFVLSAQNNAIVTKQKDLQDVCTTADVGSEKIIIDGIRSKFPTHSILSEEAGLSERDSDFRWIIDPLDGTKEYVRNIPQFNISIAVEHQGKLVVSAIYRPTDDTLYSASHNEGAYKNGLRIHVTDVSTLEDSFIYCYLPSYKRNPKDYDNSWERLKSLGKSCYRLRSFADENTALCWLAQGGHEAYINLSNPPKWHDISPGLFISLEAGAYIPDDLIVKIKNQEKCSIIVSNNKKTWDIINNLIQEKL